MAKMNSSGASPSRLVPLGICNQEANPLRSPFKIISNAKLILCNQISNEIPPNSASREALLRPCPAGLGTSLLLSPLNFPCRALLTSAPNCGNYFLLRPEILQRAG